RQASSASSIAEAMTTPRRGASASYSRSHSTMNRFIAFLLQLADPRRPVRITDYKQGSSSAARNPSGGGVAGLPIQWAAWYLGDNASVPAAARPQSETGKTGLQSSNPKTYRSHWIVFNSIGRRASVVVAK